MAPGTLGKENPAVLHRFMGLQDYEAVHRAMLDFTLARGPDTPDEIWVLQHRPVFTQGQAGKPEHILDARHIPVVKTDRGGQVTYHGPGQLVVYLLIDVKRKRLGVRELVDLIENAVVRVLDGYGIRSEGKRGAPGVYVAGRKIAALGLRVKRGCSYHGLSFNIDMDLTPFRWINPCGYEGLEVTQLKDLLDGADEKLVEQAQARLVRELRQSLIYSGATEQSG